MRQMKWGLLVTVMIAGCGQRSSSGYRPEPEGTEQSSAAQPQDPGAAADADGRPANVPASYVPTPYGWLAPDCVHELGADERVLADGRVLRTDGAYLRTQPTCTSPHYDSAGNLLQRGGSTAENAPPPPSAGCDGTAGSCWVENASATVDYLGYLTATWSVPAAPAVPNNETIYMFPGSVNTGQLGGTIMQPVLGWNQLGHTDGASAAWSLASWNCCTGNGTGAANHSTYVSANVGDSITGTMTGTGCGAQSCTSWSITTKDNTTGGTTTWTGSPDGAQNEVYAAAMENYLITDCTGLPTTNAVTFSAIQVKNTAGTVVSPTWGTHTSPNAQQPVCAYSVAKSGANIVLGWYGWTCDPGDDVACCSFPDGCSCDGDKECGSNGKWQVGCQGEGEKGHPCP